MKLTVQFNKRQTAAIGRIAAELGVTKTRVLAVALVLLQFAERERAAGNQLAVVNGGRVLKEIVWV